MEIRSLKRTFGTQGEVERMNKSGITREAWEHNTPLLVDYMRKRNICTAEIAALCNSTTFTIDNVLVGVSYGLATLWSRLSHECGIEFKIEQQDAIETPKPKGKVKSIIDYVVLHISAYGNTYLPKKDVKKIGGDEKLKELLEKEGYLISLRRNSENDFIIELIK